MDTETKRDAVEHLALQLQDDVRALLTDAMAYRDGKWSVPTIMRDIQAIKTHCAQVGAVLTGAEMLSLPDLEERRALVVSEVQRLQLQLSSRNVTVNGKRLQGSRYARWREEAMETLIAKQEEATRLKHLIAQRRDEEASGWAIDPLTDEASA